MELHWLVASVVLGLAHLVLSAVAGTQQFGLKYGMSTRDEPRALTGIPARLNRAYQNFTASFPLFAVAVLAAQALNVHNSLTLLGCELYVVARLLYVPCYAFAINGVRTLVWFASLAGIVLVLIPLLQAL